MPQITVVFSLEYFYTHSHIDGYVFFVYYAGTTSIGEVMDNLKTLLSHIGTLRREMLGHHNDLAIAWERMAAVIVEMTTLTEEQENRIRRLSPVPSSYYDHETRAFIVYVEIKALAEATVDHYRKQALAGWCAWRN